MMSHDPPDGSRSDKPLASESAKTWEHEESSLPEGGQSEPSELDDELDTEEAELVAYLDGELDEWSARRMEERLSQDPATRAKAEALKKTYDLLDYLPSPEPSPTFASRTLERLPIPSSPSGSSPAVARGSSAGLITTPNGSPASGLSLPGGGVSTLAPSSSFSYGYLIAGVALVLALVLGYVGHAAVDRYWPANGGRLSLEESRLVENLPLYASLDDFDFLLRLADMEDWIGELETASVTVTVPSVLAQAAATPPWGHDPALVRAFHALPPTRQEQLRDLDRKLFTQPMPEQTRLMKTLEAYTVWLYSLDPPERQAIFDAPSPGLRLETIRRIREHLWQQRLPASQRELLKDAGNDLTRRSELLQQWKADEQDRRRRWRLARNNWETLRSGRTPWPFDSDAMRKQVDDYVRTVLKVEGQSPGRLTPSEAAMLREARDFAEKYNVWFWYGSDLYYLSQKYPMLPEPIGPPLVRLDEQFKFLRKIADRKNLNNLQGKWPEFALALAEEAQRAKVPLPLTLGPSRPGEFRPPVEEFLSKVLMPRLSDEEKDGLTKLEGKWPQYSQEMLRLARKHDLPVPGITLPGSPRKWEETYQAPSTKSNRLNIP